MSNIFGDKQLKVVRHVGDLKSAFIPDLGITVYRSKTITIKDMGTFPCAPYDQHFVFHQKMADRGWTLFCTCGSPAAVYGYDAYKKDASAQGQLVLCMHHAMYNRHADGSS